MVRLTPIAAPLIAALTMRVAVLLLALATAPRGPQFREPDSEGYLHLAQELRAGRFGKPGEPEFERTPGYPMLLAPGVSLGHVEAVTIALQMALSCLTVWLTYQTARVICQGCRERTGCGSAGADGLSVGRSRNATEGVPYRGERTALTAAWLCALEPVSAIYANKLLTETLFTALLAGALLCLVRYCGSQRWRDVLLAAVAVAAATYVRPISYYLPLWIGPVAFFALWRKAGSQQRRAVQAAAFVALSMTLVSAWQIRNWRAAGYAGFAAIADVNFYYYEALPVVAEGRGIPPQEWDKFQVDAGQNNLAGYLARHPEQRDWPPARRYAFLRREALQIVADEPGQWLRLHLRGVANTLFDSGRNAWLGFFGIAGTSKNDAASQGSVLERLVAAARKQPLVLVLHGLLAGALIAYLGLALLGLIAWRSKTPAFFVLLAVGVYLLLLSGGAAGYHRFRLPLVPIISLCAATGFSSLRQRCGR